MNIPNAALNSLKIIFSFFVLPWNIWSATTKRLGELTNINANMQRTEFPIYTWVKQSFDVWIFLSYFLGALSAIFALIGGAGMWAFIGTLIGTYFAPLIIGWFREIIYMLLFQLNKFEEIERNTRHEAIKGGADLPTPSVDDDVV